MKQVFWMTLVFTFIGFAGLGFFIAGASFLLVGTLEQILTKLKLPSLPISWLRLQITRFGDAMLDGMEQISLERR